MANTTSTGPHKAIYLENRHIRHGNWSYSVARARRTTISHRFRQQKVITTRDKVLGNREGVLGYCMGCPTVYDLYMRKRVRPADGSSAARLLAEGKVHKRKHYEMGNVFARLLVPHRSYQGKREKRTRLPHSTDVSTVDFELEKTVASFLIWRGRMSQSTCY